MANNVIKRTWNQNKMVCIEDLSGMAFQSESGGHTFEISGIDDSGTAVSLSGTVEARFLRADNVRVTIAGTISSGKASVTLTSDCYTVAGRFSLTIFVTSNSQKVAVYSAVGNVAVTDGVSSGTVPPLVTDSIQTGSMTASGNVTVDGVLDVTQRRCYGASSGVGWHRVFRCGWLTGSSIKISIGVNGWEFHEVDFIFNTGTSFEFSCEVSKSVGPLYIDKIRAWLDQSNNYVYIDLHQSVSALVYIMVEFAPKGYIVAGELLGQTFAKMQTYGFVDVGDSPAVGSLAAEHSFAINNSPVSVQEPSSLLTSGTIAASGNLTYTATQPCWVYLMFVMQANSIGSIIIKVNNIDIVNWVSGETIPVNFAFFPIPLMPGDTLYAEQTSNRASSYKIFAMR